MKAPSNQISAAFRRIPRSFYFTGLALLLAAAGHFGNSVSRAAEKQKAPDDRVGKLLRERVETLEQVVKLESGRFEKGVPGGAHVPGMQWQRELTAARLELCATKAERLAVLEKVLESAGAREKLVTTAFDRGMGGNTAVLLARAERLAAEIALEREKAKAGK